MELLAVMAIMGILSTMAVTGYFSAVRGMTRRRAVSNLVAALNQARQRACIDGTRTALVCYNVKSDAASSDMTTVSPTYVICKALGRVTSISGNKIGDEFTPLDKIFGVTPPPSATASSFNSFGSRRLYNLSRTGWTDVGMTVEASAYSGGNSDLISGLTGLPFNPSPQLLWCFTKASAGVDRADWKIGDLYGIDVAQPGIFPKNIYFGDLGADDQSQINVMFSPDGRARTTSISIIAQDGKKIATVIVEATGNVTGGKEINLN